MVPFIIMPLVLRARNTSELTIIYNWIQHNFWTFFHFFNFTLCYMRWWWSYLWYPCFFLCWAWISVFIHITLFWSFVSFLIHVSNCVFGCFLQCLKRLLLLLVCYLVTVLFSTLCPLLLWCVVFQVDFISKYKGDHVFYFFQPQFK